MSQQDKSTYERDRKRAYRARIRHNKNAVTDRLKAEGIKSVDEDILKFITQLYKDLHQLKHVVTTEDKHKAHTDIKSKINDKVIEYKAVNNCDKIIEYLIEHKKKTKAKIKDYRKWADRELGIVKRVFTNYHKEVNNNKVIFTCSTDNFDFFKNNYPDIKKYLHNKYKNKDDKSKIQYGTTMNIYNSIATVLSFMGDEYKDITIKYRNKSTIHNEIKQSIKAQNQIPKNQLDKVLKWNAIMELEPSIRGSGKFEVFHSLIATAPRRLMDYQLLKVVYEDDIDKILEHEEIKDLLGISTFVDIDSDDEGIECPSRTRKLRSNFMIRNKAFNLDKKFNYIIVNKHGNPNLIIYNCYKFSAMNKYGVYYDNKLSKKCKGVIKQYINNNKLSSGNFVFYKNDKNTFDKDLSITIQDWFDGACGKKISINNLRHSYISWFYPTATNRQKNTICNRMSTSRNMAETNYLWNDLKQEATIIVAPKTQ